MEEIGTYIMVQELGSYDGSDDFNSFSVASRQFQNQLFEIHKRVNTVLRETNHDSEDEVYIIFFLFIL